MMYVIFLSSSFIAVFAVAAIAFGYGLFFNIRGFLDTVLCIIYVLVVCFAIGVSIWKIVSNIKGTKKAIHSCIECIYDIVFIRLPSLC